MAHRLADRGAAADDGGGLSMQAVCRAAHPDMLTRKSARERDEGKKEDAEGGRALRAAQGGHEEKREKKEEEEEGRKRSCGSDADVDDDVAYLRAHNVPNALNHVLSRCIEEQPADPVGWMERHLRHLSATAPLCAASTHRL